MSKDSAAADGLVRVYDAAKKLLDAIEQADMIEGVGDRVTTEISALAELRDVLAR